MIKTLNYLYLCIQICFKYSELFSLTDLLLPIFVYVYGRRLTGTISSMRQHGECDSATTIIIKKKSFIVVNAAATSVVPSRRVCGGRNDGNRRRTALTRRPHVGGEFRGRRTGVSHSALASYAPPSGTGGEPWSSPPQHHRRHRPTAEHGRRRDFVATLDRGVQTPGAYRKNLPTVAPCPYLTGPSKGRRIVSGGTAQRTTNVSVKTI
uniref:Uncharacterized protein n=1 Tax=Schizaphis graminum TaxID=13262 RepID=A0A2S2NSN8_SCHGA